MGCNNSVYISNMTDVWSATGNYKVGIQMDVNDISSASNSRLLDLLLNGVSKFGVNKQGIIITTSTSGWILNSSLNGFGVNGGIPSIYFSTTPVINFGSASIYPENNSQYDLGTTSKQFKNIYQTTSSNAAPSTSQYPNSGGWGVHVDSNSDTRYLAYNYNGVIDTIEFGGSFGGVTTDNTLSGNGDTTALGVDFSSDANNLSKIGSDGKLYSSISIGNTLSGNGIGVPLNINISTDANNSIGLGSDNGIYTASIETGNFLTEVLTGPTITGNGITNPFNIPLSVDANNYLSIGTDGRLYVAPDYTGVLTGGTLVGDGITTNLNVNISTDEGNGLIIGTDGGLFAATGSGIGGGGGSGVVAIRDEGSLLTSEVSSINFVGGGVTATNNGAIVTVTVPNINVGLTITGNGTTNPFNIPVSVDSNNILTTGTDGRLYVDSTISDNFATTNLALTANRTHELNGNTLRLVNNNATGLLLNNTTSMLGANNTIRGNINISHPDVDDSAIIYLRSNDTRLFSLTTNANASVLKYYDGDNSNYIGLKAPDTISTDITLTLPTGLGASGEYLKAIGGGVTEWSSASSQDTNFTTEDLTFISSRTHDLNNKSLWIANDDSTGLFLNTSSSILGGNSSLGPSVSVNHDGSVSTDNIKLTCNDIRIMPFNGSTTSSILKFYTTGTNYVSLRAPATLPISSFDLTLPTGLGSPGQYLRAAGGGAMRWETVSLSSDTNFANSDLSLSGERIHNLNSHSLTLSNSNSGTNSPVSIFPSGSVGLELSSNFQRIGNNAKSYINLNQNTNVIELTSTVADFKSYDGTTQKIRLRDNDNSNYIDLQAPTGLSSNINFVLPSDSGTNEYQLITDGSGNLSWGLNKNFANTDLLLNDNRSHDCNQKIIFLHNAFSIGFVTSPNNGIILRDEQSSINLPNCNITLFNEGQFGESGLISIRANHTDIINNGELRFLGFQNSYVGFRANSSQSFSNVVYTLPLSDGVSGQVLSTDGSGQMSWINPSSGTLSGTLSGNFDPNYYYAYTTTGFTPTSGSTFFGSNGFIVEDPFDMHVASSGYITVPKTARYILDVNGSVSNVSSGCNIQLKINGTPITESVVQDLGNDDTSTFNLVYEGNFSSLDTVEITKTNSASLFNNATLNFREQWDGTIGTNSNLTVRDEGNTLTNKASILNFIGSGVTATNVGDSVTINVPGTGTNFANTNLTLTNNRSHNLAGRSFVITGVYGEALRLSDEFMNIGSSWSTSGLGIALTRFSTIVPSPDTIDLKSNIFNLQSSTTQFGSSPVLRFYDLDNSNYISLKSVNSLNSNVELVLPTGYGASGQAITTDGAGNLAWEDVSGSFNPANTYTFGVQQHSWVPVTTEAIIDLIGTSPSQTTTLTSNRTLGFAGSVPSGLDRIYYLEVSHTGNLLTISGVHDPGTGFAQPTYSPFIIAFKTTSAGTPRFAGVI